VKHIDDFDLEKENKDKLFFFKKIKSIAKKLNLDYVERAFDNITIEVISQCNNNIILSDGIGDLITQSDLLSWADTCKKCNKHLIVITDNITLNAQKVVRDNVVILSIPELLSMSCNLEKKPIFKNFNKLFNCFIHRTSAIRQTFFYNMVQHLDINDCYFSMHCYEPFLDISPKEAFKKAHIEGEMYKDSEFEKIFKDYKNKVPIKNFQEENNNLDDIIADTKYSVVLETYGQEKNTPFICITEKTIRALTLPPILLLFSQKKSVDSLENLGFSVNTITKQNDEMDNHWDRLLEIINILYYDDRSPYDTQIQKKYAEQNIELLKSWYDKVFNTDFLESLITQETENIKN
jgi:hypothetical protein